MGTADQASLLVPQMKGRRGPSDPGPGLLVMPPGRKRVRRVGLGPVEGCAGSHRRRPQSTGQQKQTGPTGPGSALPPTICLPSAGTITRARLGLSASHSLCQQSQDRSYSNTEKHENDAPWENSLNTHYTWTSAAHRWQHQTPSLNFRRLHRKA